MADFDVFNGDADGICALIQLRLNKPRQSTLVTGVKRDIALLKRVEAKAQDRVTVLDVSLEKNAEALQRLLSDGAEVFYADHHAHGAIPDSPQLDAHLDTRSDTCTSLIINDLLDGAYTNWAITGAFGDNMNAAAEQLSQAAGLSTGEASKLKELGNLINYNGYGSTPADLHFHPADLYQELSAFRDPLQFLAAGTDTFSRLKSGFESDNEKANAIEPSYESDSVGVYSLPDAQWSRRVSGVFGNHLASHHPARAHAIVTQGKNDQLVVSLRAPIDKPYHADDIAKQFPTGGGRRRAAGINALAPERLPELIDTMEQFYR